MTKAAATTALKEAGVTPDVVLVCELHDCFSVNKMISNGVLGVTKPSEAN